MYDKRIIPVRLINIGCSFSYGNCISDYETFANKHISPGTLIAKHLACEEVNLASPGLSLDGVLRRLHSFNFEKTDRLLIGLPPCMRVQYVSRVPRNQDKIRDRDTATEYRKNAFNRGPKMHEDWFKTMKWDQDVKHSKTFDLVETNTYWSYYNILLIQLTMRHKLNWHDWKERYWLYNSIHGHMQQTTDIPEVKMLRDQIITHNYFKPDVGMSDMIDNSKYRVARDDPHPNHKLYYKWAEEFISWMQ